MGGPHPSDESGPTSESSLGCDINKALPASNSVDRQKFSGESVKDD